MALRLNDLVVCGELIATRHYGVHGWLGLRGTDRPVSLQLTGNPDPDLIGRHIRFEARAVHPELLPEAPERPDLTNLAWQQIGPTGTMTAARTVRVADCPPAELYRRAKLGEPPPTEWKPCLYLEWYSQNGRVVVELIDPIIEDVPAEAGETAVADDSAADDPLLEDPGDDTISALGADDAMDAGLSEIDDSEFSGPPDDDPYNLFPDELQQELDAQARNLDRQLDSGEEKPRDIREMELLDDLIENSDGEPIVSLFDSPLKLPRPDDLDDVQAEQALKVLLAQLALFGIALDVCRHYTPRDAYRLLLEEICVEERAYPELRQTQWVQHFMTSEYCDQCDAEMEEEFRQYERRRGEGPPEEGSADDEPDC